MGDFAVVNCDTGEIVCRTSTRREGERWRTVLESRGVPGDYGVIALDEVVEVP